MAVTYDVMGVSSMVVADRDIGRAVVGPAEHDAPLRVDADGMEAG